MRCQLIFRIKQYLKSDAQKSSLFNWTSQPMCRIWLSSCFLRDVFIMIHWKTSFCFVNLLKKKQRQLIFSKMWMIFWKTWLVVGKLMWCLHWWCTNNDWHKKWVQSTCSSKNDKIKFVHCMIHKQALVSNSMSDAMRQVMDEVKRCAK